MTTTDCLAFPSGEWETCRDAQSLGYSRPVHAGDRLTVTSVLRPVGRLAGRDVPDIHHKIHDATGCHVVTTTGQLLLPGP